MELWDVYDINKKKTGKVINRHSNQRLKDGEYHIVVQAIIININGEILLSRRSKQKQKYPLMWECCGGSCIKGETSLQAILRELREELGLNFKQADAIFYKTIRDDRAKDFKDLWIFRNDVKDKDIKFTDGEVIDSKWVTIEEFETMFKNKKIVPTVDFSKEDYKTCIYLKQRQSFKYLGSMVTIKIDRQMGAKHPKWDMIYPINYGYVPNTISGDGEELDAYLLGVFEPVQEYTGKCIAVVHRTKEDDDKLIIVPEDKNYTKEQIQALTEFQERFFESEIIKN